MTSASALVDTVRDEHQAFADLLETGRFSVQQCTGCGHWDFPPGPTCTQCGSPDLTWYPVEDGAGTARSVVTCYRSFMEFSSQVPYTVVLGELAGIPCRVVGRWLLQDPPRIGSEVELVWGTTLSTSAPGNAPYGWTSRQQAEEA